MRQDDWLNYAQMPTPQRRDVPQLSIADLLSSLIAKPPTFAVEGGRGEAPRYSGGVSVPLAGGELGLRGSYSRPDQESPPDWGAMLQFKRRF